MRRPEGEVRPRSTCGGASGDHWLLRELAAMDERLSRQLCKVQEQVVRLEDRLASSMEARSAAVEGKQAATEWELSRLAAASQGMQAEMERQVRAAGEDRLRLQLLVNDAVQREARDLRHELAGTLDSMCRKLTPSSQELGRLREAARSHGEQLAALLQRAERGEGELGGARAELQSLRAGVDAARAAARAEAADAAATAKQLVAAAAASSDDQLVAVSSMVEAVDRRLTLAEDRLSILQGETHRTDPEILAALGDKLWSQYVGHLKEYLQDVAFPHYGIDSSAKIQRLFEEAALTRRSVEDLQARLIRKEGQQP